MKARAVPAWNRDRVIVQKMRKILGRAFTTRRADFEHLIPFSYFSPLLDKCGASRSNRVSNEATDGYNHRGNLIWNPLRMDRNGPIPRQPDNILEHYVFIQIDFIIIPLKEVNFLLKIVNDARDRDEGMFHF